MVHFVRDISPRQIFAEALPPRVRQDALEAAGLVLVAVWKEVLSQPGTGRVYEPGTRFLTVGNRTFAIEDDREGRPSQHVASAPGEPPAVDFGDLRNSIDMESEPDKVFVGSSSPVAAWLQWGVGTAEAVGGPHPGGIVIEPRPHADRAFEQAQGAMTDAVMAVIRGQ